MRGVAVVGGLERQRRMQTLSQGGAGAALQGVEGRAAPRVAPHAVGSPWRPAGQPLANPPVGVAQGILSPQLLVHQAGGGCCNGGCLVWVAPRPVHRGQQIAVVGPEESERQPPNVVGAAQRRAASANGPHRGCRLAPAPSACGASPDGQVVLEGPGPEVPPLVQDGCQQGQRAGAQRGQQAGGRTIAVNHHLRDAD